MLHLDDELAGLIEAADTPAGQDKMHSPQPGALLPAEVPSVQSKSATVYFAICCCAVLRCAALCCAVLRCACCAMPARLCRFAAW